MGHSHSIKTVSHTREQWAEFVAQCRAIFAATDVKLAGPICEGPPIIDNQLVAFNGVGPDSHESCAVAFGEVCHSFTKTNRKPYDEVVQAVYIAAKCCLGATIGTDAGSTASGDWVPGWGLHYRATENM